MLHIIRHIIALALATTCACLAQSPPPCQINYSPMLQSGWHTHSMEPTTGDLLFLWGGSDSLDAFHVTDYLGRPVAGGDLWMGAQRVEVVEFGLSDCTGEIIYSTMPSGSYQGSGFGYTASNGLRLPTWRFSGLNHYMTGNPYSSFLHLGPYRPKLTLRPRITAPGAGVTCVAFARFRIVP